MDVKQWWWWWWWLHSYRCTWPQCSCHIGSILEERREGWWWGWMTAMEEKAGHFWHNQSFWDKNLWGNKEYENIGTWLCITSLHAWKGWMLKESEEQDADCTYVMMRWRWLRHVKRTDIDGIVCVYIWQYTYVWTSLICILKYTKNN